MRVPWVRVRPLPFGWNIFEINLTVGGLFGYSSVNSIANLNVPSSNGVSLGLLKISHCLYHVTMLPFTPSAHPNITAFHNIILLSVGAPLTPAGGSC